MGDEVDSIGQQLEEEENQGDIKEEVKGISREVGALHSDLDQVPAFPGVARKKLRPGWARRRDGGMEPPCDLQMCSR